MEVLVDFGTICVSFLAAYLLFVDDGGDDVQRAVFLATLPVLLAVRYVLFVLFGIYRRIWRFASARDLFAIVAAVALSVPPTVAVIAKTQPLGSFPAEIFLVDALLCATLVAGSRLALRVLPGFGERTPRGERTRILIVGAGRSGRALARELGETSDRRVVGFLDDNTGLRRRRIHAVTVHGSLDELPRLVESLRADEVLVTIPDAPEKRLAELIAACDAAEVPCSFVRREIAPPPARAQASVE